MTPVVRKWLGAVLVVSGLLVPGLDTWGGPVGRSVGSPPRFEQVRETTGGQDRAVYTVKGRENLGDVEKTLELPIPFVGETWTEFLLLLGVSVDDGAPDGRMIAVLSRVRDGRTRRLQRLSLKFEDVGGDEPFGGAIAAFDLDPADFQASDVLSVALTFKTGYELRRGDTVSYFLFWDARDRLALPQSTVVLDSARMKSDKLVPGERFAVLSRVQDYTIRPRTRIDEVQDVVNLWVPDFGDDNFSDQTRFFVAASISTPDDAPEGHVAGRMKAALVYYPADGGPREVLARTSQKLVDSRASWRPTLPRPEGFGGGDRIAVEFSFRSDSETPRGDDSRMSLTAQAVVIEDQ